MSSNRLMYDTCEYKTRLNEIIKSEKKAKEAGQITYFKNFQPTSASVALRDGIPVADSYFCRISGLI